MRNAVIGSLRVNLGIDTAQFSNGLETVSKRLDRVGKQMQSVGRSMAASLTAPLGTVGGVIIKMAADFEKGMTDVRAVLRPTEREFAMLTRTAEELGRTTKFTATEAASGMEMLARNGLNTAQILGGATDATLNLAAAAGSELSPAADAITDIMVNFRKSGEDMKQVIDQVAGTLVSSKLGWEDYRLALGQAAGAAGPLGMSFEDMNAALAATAASFSSGVEAGTSLKGFLLKLAPSSKQSKENIRALGLEFWDAAGNMKPLAAIAQELQDKLGGLNKKSQTEVLGQLFGQRVVRTALRLMEEGAAGVDRFRAAISTGNAEEMAADRMDNLWGSVTLLKSAWEGLSIAIGKSGLTQWARSFVDGLKDVVLSLSEAHPAMLRFITVFAGLTAAAGLLLIALGLTATVLAAVSLPITGVVAAIAAASAVIAIWGSDLEQLGRTIQIIFKDIYDAARTWLIDKFGWVVNDLVELGRTIQIIFKDIYDAARTWLIDKFGWVIDDVANLVNRMVSAFRWLAGKLGLKSLANTLKTEFSGVAQNVGNVLDAVKAYGTNTFDTLKGVGTSAANAVASAWERAGQQMANSMLKGFSAVAENMLITMGPKSVPVPKPVVGSGTFDSSASSDAERTIKELKKQRTEVESEAKQVFDATRTPAEALQIEITRLNDLVNSGAISFDTYRRAVEKAQSQFSEWHQMAENVSQSFGRSLEDMVMDGKNWRDSLSGFLKDISRQILRMAVLTPLMKSMTSGIGSLFGVDGAMFSGLPGFANGGSFNVGGAGGIDSQLVAFRASPNERVSVTKPGQDGRHGGELLVTVRGTPELDAQIESTADNVVVRRAPQIVGQSVQQSARNTMPTIAAYQRQKAGGDYRG